MAKSGADRKLTTILVTDAVGFSQMMGQDEAGTLEALKNCHRIIKDSIDRHGGRVFGGAGDSVIAEFSSPLQAIVCASDFQQSIANRNRECPEGRRMVFRVGINLGDVMVDGDNLFGEGVNIAARLEQIGEPGGVCVSAKVYDEVRRNLDLSFINGGAQTLKNISEPVAVYHVRPETDDISHKTGNEIEKPTQLREPETNTGGDHQQRSIVVHQFKVSGDEETVFLAEGLRDGIVRILSNYSAINLIAHDEDGQAPPDFVLEGSVRGRGGHHRLSFGLIDSATNSQVWSERYDRHGVDTFEIEDEISQAVASVLRVKLKALGYAALLDADNKSLSVPQLLDKAAGFLVRSVNHDEAEAALRLAIKISPDNAMALAMLAASIFDRCDYSPLSLANTIQQELRYLVEQAVSLDPNDYFARLVAAIEAQDLEGDFEKALLHGKAALEKNPNLTPVQAVVATSQCHLGQLDDGLRDLQLAIKANKDDPQRFRNNRELALALFMADKIDEALSVSARLVEMAPKMDRNKLVHAALLWHAGQIDRASEVADWLKANYPELAVNTMRPFRFMDKDVTSRFNKAFPAMGFDVDSNIVAIGK